VSNALSEKTIYFQSDLFNYAVYQIIGVLMGNSTGEITGGRERRKRKRKRGREREQQISGVREGALVRNGSGMGWKRPLVEKDTRVFLVTHINRINRLSIMLGRSQILSFTGAGTFSLTMACFFTEVKLQFK
jgi:hypothetical protein